MPKLVFSNINLKTVKIFRNEMVEKLSKTTNTSRDDFTIEINTNEFLTGDYPFIDIYWFKRDLDVQDQVANIINDILNDNAIEEMDIYFHELEKRNYYYKREHF
ncbi:MAG: DUF1904 family protein [Clostridiales bacterium]|nr:DUF1904 family protein [Clostridiales bacterium]